MESIDDLPQTRADCENRNGNRPCPHVGCRYHLALNVSPKTGEIKTFLFGERYGTTLARSHFKDNRFLGRLVRKILDMPETCVLDVADRGGMDLEEISALIGVSREGIRVIEIKALRKLKRDPRLQEIDQLFDE